MKGQLNGSMNQLEKRKEMDIEDSNSEIQQDKHKQRRVEVTEMDNKIERLVEVGI